jgi:hypothetical protein
MLGYFISEEDAKKLSLLKKLKINSKLQKVFFVITDKDVMEKEDDPDLVESLSLKKISSISNWLNKNYYDTTVEIIIDQLKSRC